MKMAKEKKAHKMHSIKMDVVIAAKLEEFCKETGFSKTQVIERGIDHYIDVYRAVLTMPKDHEKYNVIANMYGVPAALKEQEAQRKGKTNED